MQSLGWALITVLLGWVWTERIRASACSVTHWAAGDVVDRTAVLWARADREGWMRIQVEGPGGGNWALPATAERDFTVKLSLRRLRPDRLYRYRVWCSEPQARKGSFRTAPSPETPATVRFAWGGDVGGQNVCRDARLGYPLFTAVEALQPDFFLGLGDMIYADGRCEATGRYGNAQIPGSFGPAVDVRDFWAHWRYNLEEANFQRLRAHVPYIAVWDDHEVVNDLGPLHDTQQTPPHSPRVHLLPFGLRAFLDYNPVAEEPKTPGRLYRAIRWGKHLDLILLDTRQYRDANSAPDSKPFPKTLLGREQLTWLKARLKASEATWKVIASSVPLSIPTGFPPENGRDGWANFDQNTGFENELWEIVRFLRDEGIRNVVFITTDVHFATGFRYRPFPEDPGFELYEFVSGPMNAGLFPNPDFDLSLNPKRLFFFGPSDEVATYEEAVKWMNFGVIQIDRGGVLQASVRDVRGEAVYEITLKP